MDDASYGRATIPGLVLFFLIAQGVGAVVDLFSIINILRFSMKLQGIGGFLLLLMVVQIVLYLSMLRPAIALKQGFPPLAQAYLWFSLVSALMLFVISVTHEPARYVEFHYLIVAAWCVVWIAYFLKSGRIDATYRHPLYRDPPPAARQEPPQPIPAVPEERLNSWSDGNTEFAVGNRVSHDLLGEGVVAEIVKRPDAEIVFMVAFPGKRRPSDIKPAYLSKLS